MPRPSYGGLNIYDPCRKGLEEKADGAQTHAEFQKTAVKKKEPETNWEATSPVAVPSQGPGGAMALSSGHEKWVEGVSSTLRPSPGKLLVDRPHPVPPLQACAVAWAGGGSHTLMLAGPLPSGSWRAQKDTGRAVSGRALPLLPFPHHKHSTACAVSKP